MDAFKQIAAFVAVATQGGLSAAARVEGVTPAIMGRRLDALEARLGVKLLQRTTRRLSLTFEGSAFLENCQRLLTDLANAEASVTLGSIRASGHVRLTAPAGFGRRHVAPLLAAFCRQHPEVQVSLDLSDRMVDLVNEGMDCAIRINGEHDHNLVSIKLAENRRLVVASPAYLAERGTPQTLEDLSQHHCLLLGSSNQQRGWQFQRQGERVTIKVQGPLCCNDGAVLHEWALAGMGLAWRSLWEVGDDLRAGRLLTVLDAFRTPASHIDMVFPQQRQMPLRVRLLIDYLKTCYAAPGYWGTITAPDG
ncbi:LysR family transcriptional regulator [Leeia aquatica]|uniref:LysR family transcriptional regulator n=1 Tax=Leeia aquatica TaxID=2725557 RepID=A0A847S8L8_9NEIS|nr:LysR family transcriptional regulator [Leeia aquatica]NLR73699.1 LysR family transcriptional regulator [Leeia aquatica]